MSGPVETFRGISLYRWWTTKHPFALTGVYLATLAGMVAVQAGAWIVVAAVLPVLLAVAVQLIPTVIVFHDDWLAVDRLGGRRIIPYASIARVETLQRLATAKDDRERTIWVALIAARLHLTTGESLDVPFAEVQEPPALPSVRATGMDGDFGAFDRTVWELTRRIESMAQAAREARAPSGLVASLRRGGRSVRAWREALIAPKASSTDPYRAGDAHDEPLWSVLEDDKAPRDARAAAAVVLRSRLDDAGRARLRIAVDACALPTLRSALETTLDRSATPGEIDDALDRVSGRR